MTPVMSDYDQMRARRDFLFGLNNTAMYAATRGSPLFLASHISFLMAYVDRWLKSQPGPEDDKEKAVMEALFRHSPKWAKHLTLRLLKAGWITEKAKRLLLLTPLLIPLVATLPWQFIWSGVKSAWDILGKGVRTVP